MKVKAFTPPAPQSNPLQYENSLETSTNFLKEWGTCTFCLDVGFGQSTVLGLLKETRNKEGLGLRA